MKIRKGLISLLFIFMWCICCAQYSWDIRDPVDFDFVDFGDNKVLLYNGIGIGLSLWLHKDRNSADQRLRRVDLGIQYFREYKREPLSQLLRIHYRKRYRIRDFLYFGGEANMTFVEDTQLSTIGVGAILAFEWHIIRRPSFRLIYDNGVGPNYFIEPFPFGGTKVNFSTVYGIRFEFLMSENWFHFSILNLHLSNANIKGSARNPALDALGLRMGFLF